MHDAERTDPSRSPGRPAERPAQGSSGEHPDLVAIDRAITARLDALLDAEQQAMEVFVRRQATFRDRLLDLEDSGEPVEIATPNGVHRGVVRAAAVDHVELVDGHRAVLIPLRRVESVATA